MWLLSAWSTMTGRDLDEWGDYRRIRSLLWSLPWPAFILFTPHRAHGPQRVLSAVCDTWWTAHISEFTCLIFRFAFLCCLLSKTQKKTSFVFWLDMWYIPSQKITVLMYIINYISPHITFRIPAPHTRRPYFNGWLSAQPSGYTK